MKQILQNMANGETTLVEAPAPVAGYGTLVIGTTCSLISAGTERMLVGFGKGSLIEKARQQPEKVRMVLEKIRTDGLFSTLDAVRSKLAQPLPLGYCNVGVVHQVGEGVSGIAVGDRVVSNGSHAEMVRVGANLCQRIPDSVDDESASFTIVASIGLQGVRLAMPTLGETFVVTGAGLIGLLTIQLLRASGCRVLAVDFDDAKLEVARKFGAEVCNMAKGEDPVAAGMTFSKGRGVDGVIIAASTPSSDPVSQAARMSRKRGRIVLVGVAGLELNRAEFYEKELTFQVSCSYGPGRYDKQYEELGQDYPLGYVRWTEKRNFEAVLDMLAGGQLDAKSLVTHRFAFEDAPAAYETLVNDKSAIAMMLHYGAPFDTRVKRSVKLGTRTVFDPQRPTLGVIGAGNYASRVLLPAFRMAGAQLRTIVAAGGVNAVIHGRKFGFEEASSDVQAVFDDPEVNTIVVVTRHDSHASLVVKALQSGKNVYVEKPLALNFQDLTQVQEALAMARTSMPGGGRPQLMVGFNRRFAPQVRKIKELLDSVKEPKSFIMTMNAGAIPASHWVQDTLAGGGRIIGEACHLIDLMRFLAGSPIASVHGQRMGNTSGVEVSEDKASITLGFEDGSFGTVHYLANGAASFPKERIEVFVAGRVLQLDNFRGLRGYGWPGFRKYNLWKQDKGQLACVMAFLKGLEEGFSTIPSDEVFEVARVTIEAAEQLRKQ